MAQKVSKRKTAPSSDTFERRRNWGARLLVEFNGLRKTPKWLAEQVGYKEPKSMHQVVNGHQGVSEEVYRKILTAVPEMGGVPQPPMVKKRQGAGSPGPHKQHDYPKLGPISSRRAPRTRRQG